MKHPTIKATCFHVAWSRTVNKNNIIHKHSTNSILHKPLPYRRTNSPSPSRFKFAMNLISINHNWIIFGKNTVRRYQTKSNLYSNDLRRLEFPWHPIRHQLSTPLYGLILPRRNATPDVRIYFGLSMMIVCLKISVIETIRHIGNQMLGYVPTPARESRWG